MIDSEDKKLIQRVQTLGRSLVTNLFQLFRSAEIYEENNDIFRRIADSMRNHIEESYRYLNSCNLKISSHNVYISGHRIYIDFGLLESVSSLSKIFQNGSIGGISLLQDCLDKHNLIRGLLAFRETLVVDQRKGVDAIKKGMIERHTPFISPIKLDVHEVKVSGLRDEENARKFVLKNALKFMVFLENMHRSYETKEQIQMTIIYRIILNLIRVFELHPSLIKALLNIIPPNSAIHEQFAGALFLLVVLGDLKVSRQMTLNVVVDSLFHKISKMADNSRFLSDKDQAIVGSKKLLETRYINRSFFFRLNFAFHTPLKGEDTQDIDFTRLFKTIQALILQLKSQELLQTAIVNLLKSSSKEIHKPSVLLIARALGLLAPGQKAILDGKKPVVIDHWKSKESEAELNFTTLDPINLGHKERINWILSGESEWIGYLNRLTIVPPTCPSPNPIKVILNE